MVRIMKAKRKGKIANTLPAELEAMVDRVLAYRPPNSSPKKAPKGQKTLKAQEAL